MVQQTRPADDPTIEESPLLKTQVEEPLPAPTGTLVRAAEPTTTVQPAVEPAPTQPIAQPAAAPTEPAPAPAPAIPPTPTIEVQPEQTVAGQLEGLLAQESPFITQARARAEQEAHRKGLRSSTLAVQAGEQAAISQALPIAQIDAQFNQRLAEMGLGFEQTVALENLSADNKERLIRVQDEIEQSNLDRAESNHLQTAYINGVSQLNTQFQEIFNNIQQNPDIRNKEEALSIAQAQFDDGMNLLNASFSSMPGWQQDWAVVSGGIGAAGTPVTPEGEPAAPAGVTAATEAERTDEVNRLISTAQQALAEDVDINSVQRSTISGLQQVGATAEQARQVLSSFLPADTVDSIIRTNFS